jgi:hypothetical protein
LPCLLKWGSIFCHCSSVILMSFICSRFILDYNKLVNYATLLK